MAKTAIVIVTYNRCALLQECLDALAAQTVQDYEIVLMDNHSTDDTEHTLRPRALQEPRLHYERLAENVGGAGGYNAGLRRAGELGCDYIWLMDDDAIPAPDALQKLLEAAQQIGKFGFLAGKVLWTDGSLCKMNIPLWAGDRTATRPPVKKATFVSLLLPLSVVKEVGLPIKEFFIWGDDQEYTSRISKKYPCYYVENSTVLHKTTANCGSDLVHDEPQKIQRYRYKYRNELLISKRTGVASTLYYLYRLLRDTAQIALCSTEKGPRIAIAWKGFAEGIRFNPAVEYLKTNG